MLLKLEFVMQRVACIGQRCLHQHLSIEPVSSMPCLDAFHLVHNCRHAAGCDNASRGWSTTWDYACLDKIGSCKSSASSLVAAVIFLILATIPLYVMCCCSEPPYARVRHMHIH
jgi:hypothetical protein